MRNIRQGLFWNIGQGRRRGLINNRPFSAHLDNGIHRTHVQLQVDCGEMAHFKIHSGALESLKPLRLDHNGVAARRQVCEAVITRCVRHHHF